MSNNCVDIEIEIPAAKTDVFREDVHRPLTLSGPYMYPGEGLVFVHGNVLGGVYFKAADVLDALAKVLDAEITVKRTTTTTEVYSA